MQQSATGDDMNIVGAMISRLKQEIATERNQTKSPATWKRGRCSLDVFCVRQYESRRRRKHLHLH